MASNISCWRLYVSPPYSQTNRAANQRAELIPHAEYLVQPYGPLSFWDLWVSRACSEAVSGTIACEKPLASAELKGWNLPSLRWDLDPFDHGTGGGFLLHASRTPNARTRRSIVSLFGVCRRGDRDSR